jgi:hypothetical protein
MISAAFFAAGKNQHCHIATNTWIGTDIDLSLLLEQFIARHKKHQDQK